MGFPFFPLESNEHLMRCHLRQCVVRATICGFHPAIVSCDRGRESNETRFENRKACISVVEVQRVHFDHHKACRRLIEVQRVRFDHRKACIGGVWKIAEPV